MLKPTNSFAPRIPIVHVFFIALASVCDSGAQVSGGDHSCRGIPLNDRIWVSVGQFSASAATFPVDFVEKLPAMLVHDLIGSNCFQVSEFGVWEPVGLPPARWLVSGEITEFAEEKREDMAWASIGKMLKQGSESFADFGLNLWVIDFETGKKLASKQFHQKALKTGDMGRRMFHGIPSPETGIKSKAMSVAVENLLFEVCAWFSDGKEAFLKVSGQAPSNLSLISLSNCDPKCFFKIEETLNALPGVVGVRKSFSGGVACFKLRHRGRLDEIAAALEGLRSGMKIKISDRSENKIEGTVE